MLYDLNDIIHFEILVEQQRIKDNSHKKFLALLLQIKEKLEQQASIAEIKKIIKKSNVNKRLKSTLKRMIKQQLSIITGEDENFSLAEEALAGYTFLELIKLRDEATQKQAIRFMAQAKELIKEGKPLNDLIDNEVKKYKTQQEGFYRTQTKKAREYGYNKVDKKLSKKVRGWISVAILDNRTSAICSALHNKFYKIKDYPTRFDIPNPPPRHPNCYDKKTSVYTRDGFKLFKDIKVGEECLTFNPITRDLKWSKVIRTYKKYEKQIYSIKSNTVSMCVSKDHPMIGYKRSGKYRELKFIKTNNVEEAIKSKSEFKLYATSRFKGLDKRTININGLKLDTYAYVKFMALYLSDGHYSKKSNQVIISQIRRKDIFNDILKELNLKVSIWKEKLSICDKRLYDYVKKFGNFQGKYIPNELKELSPKYLGVFIDTYLIADGHKAKDKTIDGYISKGSKSLFTTNKRLSDDLVEIIIKAGYSCSVAKRKAKDSTKKDGTIIHSRYDLYVISILSNEYRSLDYCNIDLIDYNDSVYDIEVEENHTLLTKHNGKIIWGSNCRSILLTVWEGTRITDYKGQKIETFLRQNPKIAESILGKKKYRIFKSGQAKITSFVDIKGKRWYRNDEIIKRLGIKSKKRLDYIEGV